MDNVVKQCKNYGIELILTFFLLFGELTSISSVPTEKKKVMFATWLIGLTTGLCIPVLLMILYICIQFPSETFPMVHGVIITYRMAAMAILLIWFWFVFSSGFCSFCL